MDGIRKVRLLTRVRNKSIGSVEGRLELVSTHVRTRRFNIYHAITNKAVRCNLPVAMEEQAISNLGRRVIVSGIVSYNAVGEPVKVEVDRLRVLKEEKELPTIVEMLGMTPDITGDLSTEEHIRQLRDG